MARPGRFELPPLGLEDKSRCAISLLFLGSAYLLYYRFPGPSGPAQGTVTLACLPYSIQQNSNKLKHLVIIGIFPDRKVDSPIRRAAESPSHGRGEWIPVHITKSDLGNSTTVHNRADIRLDLMAGMSLNGISATTAGQDRQDSQPEYESEECRQDLQCEASPDSVDSAYRSLSSFGQFCRNRPPNKHQHPCTIGE